MQQQVDQQKAQLELQAKQIQANQVTPTAIPAQQQTTTTNKTACDKATQTRQINFMNAIIYNTHYKKTTAQSRITEEENKLTNPNLSTADRNFINTTIRNLNMTISDAEMNLSSYNSALANVNNCKLYSSASLSAWGKALGVTY